MEGFCVTICVVNVGFALLRSSCSGGYLKLSSSDIFSSSSFNMEDDDEQVAVCGQNERYSPPLVLFQDFAESAPPPPPPPPPSSSQQQQQQQQQVRGRRGRRTATLLLRVDEPSTSRSTFYAHFSFTRASDPELGLRMRGAVRREYEDGEFREQEGERSKRLGK